MTEPIDRRTLLRRGATAAAAGAALLSGGGFLAACGAGSTGGQSAPAAGGKPRRGGNLRIGVWTEEASLLPLQTNWDGVGDCYGEAFFDSLMAVDIHGKVVPYLAKSLTHDPGFTKWTIGLRPGIKFHDGAPLDSAAMVANLKAFIASPNGYTFANVKSVTASGPRTVDVTMKQPWVPFDAYLVGSFPQSPATLGPKYKGPPVGTGPFSYQAWQPGNHLYVTRNKQYWRPGLPYLDQVSFLPILDSQQKENSLLAGNIDIALVGATIDDMGRLKTNKSLQYIDGSKVTGPESGMVYWMINCSIPPTDDVRVRNAMACAIDQRLFWKEVFIGSGSAAGPGSDVAVTGPFQPGSPYYEADTGYPKRQDMAKAKALVAAYKADKGHAPKVTLTATTERKELTALQLTQSMWQEAGIDVTIQQLDVATLIVRGLKGQLQATYWDFGAAIDPDQNYPAWSPSYSAKVGTIALEPTRLSDPRINPLLNTGRTSTDPAARATAYKQLARIFGELTPFIYMGRDLGGYAAAPHVQNLTTLTSPDGVPLSWAQPGLVATQMWLA